MTALIGMRLAGFVRTGRASAPLLAALVVLGVLYGGGQAQAGEAYGVSAAVLFPVLAWQSTLLLDTEPDVARRLALLAVAGHRRETSAGLLAAGSAGLVTVGLALLVPWLLGGVTGPRAPGDPPLAQGVLLGVWAHLLVLPAAVALGALASRPVTGRRSLGLAVLVLGAVLAFVLGTPGSAMAWSVPPLLAAARASTGGAALGAVAGLTLWALGWSALALTGYAVLRRSRA